MDKVIVIDPEKCTACGLCEMVCSAVKDGTFNRNLSRIRVVSLEPKIDVALTCRLCDDPACVKACPRKALSKGEKGKINVDNAKCTGCSWCIEACDFGSISIHPDKHVVMICDLCDGKPECVKNCPPEALMFITPSNVASKARLKSIKNLFQIKKDS